MGIILINTFNCRYQGLSSYIYKTIIFITILSFRNQENIDIFLLTWWIFSLWGFLFIPETHVWDIWNRIISFHYLTERPWKDSLCDMFSLSVNLWLAFDGKLSDGLLSFYFVYIDLLVRGRWIYSGNLFFSLFACNFQWLNNIKWLLMQLIDCCPENIHYWVRERHNFYGSIFFLKCWNHDSTILATLLSPFRYTRLVTIGTRIITQYIGYLPCTQIYPDFIPSIPYGLLNLLCVISF